MRETDTEVHALGEKDPHVTYHLPVLLPVVV